MKKHLLVLAAFAASIAATASVNTLGNAIKLHPELNPELSAAAIAPDLHNSTPMKAAGEDTSADEVYYTLAGDPYTALSFNSQSPGMQVAMAFQIDPEFIATLTDGKITGISYYTGTETNSRENKITKAYVFIAEQLGTSDAMFLYTQEVEAPTTAFTRVDAVLDTPFTIPEGKKVYCGVYFNINSANNAAVVVDYTGHVNEYGGWYAVRSSSKGNWAWDNLTDYYGFLTLGATIRSSTFPYHNVSVIAVDGQPAALAGEPFPFSFLLNNNGMDAVENLTVEYGVEGEESITETITAAQPVGMNQVILGMIPQMVVNNPTKSADLHFKVTAVNGEANNATETTASYPLTVVLAEQAKDRNVVIEEFTSTSCAYCPVGYTAMEQIHEEYTDGRIIPVCIHVNYAGRDPLTASSYNQVYRTYCTEGVPSTTVNRTYDQYPYFDELSELAYDILGIPGIASVTAEASLDEATRKLTVNTKTSFAFDYTDGADNFILSYGITENEVGPYTQNNGYAGYGQSVPGGWENQPSSIDLIYNDVARQLDKYAGITGSIPAEITAGTEYDFTHEMTLVNAINDLSKINLVVYLVNRKTGEIENACQLKAPFQNQSGIADVISDGVTDAPVEYFNLQGVSVTQPSSGIYIRRQGDKVSKVVVR